MMAEIALIKRVKYAGDVHKELLKAGWDIEAATLFVNNIPDANKEICGNCPRDMIMNPVRKYRSHYSDDYCPVCGKQQKTVKRSMEKPWFCERCGQKLGWDGFNG